MSLASEPCAAHAEVMVAVNAPAYPLLRIADGSDEGMTKLLFDDPHKAPVHGTILGGALEIQTVGTA